VKLPELYLSIQSRHSTSEIVYENNIYRKV